MIDLTPPPTAPVAWIVTYGIVHVHVMAQTAAEAYRLAYEDLPFKDRDHVKPGFAECVCRMVER